MKGQIRKSILSFAIVAILLLLLSQFSMVSAAESNQEKVIVFLRDVAGLDMDKYELTDTLEFDGTRYTFTADSSTIDVICLFQNDKIVRYALFPMSGSPLVTEPVSDVLSAARRVVDRYQNYSKAAYVSQMQETLGMVSELKVDAEEMASFYTLKKSAYVSVGNLSLTVWVGADYEDGGNVQFVWTKTVNGIENIYNKMIFEFHKGVLQNFADAWDSYLVGCDEVKVSEEDAVGLAVERLKTFSYSVGDVLVDNLTVAKDVSASAEVSMQPRKVVDSGSSTSSYMLFPHWEIYLPLDRVYLGNVVSVRVMMWADTGVIDSFEASSTLGTPSDQTPTPTPSANPTPSPTPAPTQSPSITPTKTPTDSPSAFPSQQPQATPPTDLYIIAAVAVALVVVVAVAALFMRRRK